ncbi:MAG TPA: hypothetical protein VIA62_00230 [Thermoanaerobaculia bacterium]|jgi:hypothetical protein|nr:hypothetical protein [Thermoanaerobaculia bacterium]
MPELAPQFSAPPDPPPPPPPADLEDDDGPVIAVAPPVIDPAAWETFPAFRETFLAYFTIPKHNAALRVVGNLLLDMTLASWGEWPDQPEGWLRGQLRAVVADLRHLEGFLVTLTESPSPDPYEGALHRTATLMSREIGSVAEHIEGKLGSWRGEVE